MGHISSPDSAILGAMSASHGFDDIGFDQISGSFTAVDEAAGHAGGRYDGKAIINDTAHGLKKGQPINITGTVDYNGLTRVLHVINANAFIIDKDFVEGGDESGSWDVKGGKSAWVAFMPIGADLPAVNLSSITFWDENAQSGDINAVAYTKDQMYFFPGIIKEILLATSGNIRLFRHSDLNPGGNS